MPRTYLAFDYGSKRIGLAVGNDLTCTSQPLPAINTRDLLATDRSIKPAAVASLIKTWGISHLVFGLPLNAEGAETRLSKEIRSLGVELGRLLELPVSFADERYSSGEADRRLRVTQGAGKRFSARKIALRDSVAAQLILETYFSYHIN